MNAHILLKRVKYDTNKYVNSHVTAGTKCVEIVKTLNITFFLFGPLGPIRSLSVNPFREIEIKWTNKFCSAT